MADKSFNFWILTKTVFHTTGDEAMLNLSKLWKLCDELKIEFFTLSPQYKNANITNFILAVPLKVKKTNNKVSSLER